MEKDLANTQNQQEGKTIRDLLLIFKKSFWLILAIIVLFVALGAGYSFIENPSFTASRKVIFTCENVKQDHGKDSNTTTNNIDTMRAYETTIMDFCTQGFVVDRANRYYINYRNLIGETGDNIAVEEYINDYLEIDPSYNYEKVDGEIYSKEIKVKTLAEEKEAQFAFMVEYTDDSTQEAYDKLKLLIYAFKQEVGAKKENSDDLKYFGNFNVYIEDLGSMGVASNNSKVKNLLIFGAIGVVVAFLVVYIKTVANNTITTKDELERIVGAPVFAAVESKE
jgi:capsular polysaccharide biosynthesis protein